MVCIREIHKTHKTTFWQNPTEYTVYNPPNAIWETIGTKEDIVTGNFLLTLNDNIKSWFYKTYS